MSPRSRTLAALAVTCAAIAAGAPAAAGATLDWQDCADGFQCASFDVPRDYAVPDGPTIALAVIRLPATDQANRIGSLFLNFGGPGGTAVDTIHEIGKEVFGTLNERFDIVGFDPRGVGQSSPAIDCQIDHETEGPVAQPFITPDTLNANILTAVNERYIQRCARLNPGILPYVSTANNARDMDALREAMGDSKLSYLGFSYGTFLGATYASMFPDNYRALVLDGALDADQYINRPTEVSRAQTAAFERELDRFFDACANDQDACAGFGGDDPRAAFDALVARAEEDPIPAPRIDFRPVDGDDIRLAATQSMYAKPLWPILAIGLARAEAGDGRILRLLVNIFIGREPGQPDDPGFDRFFAISALEGRFATGVGQYLDAGARSFADFEHFWFNTGYTDLAWAQYAVEPRGAFFGPFALPDGAPPVLVVGTTFDPATPFRGSKRLVRELAPAARLLTMRGDGHTAYPGNSPCIDAAVEKYLNTVVLPPSGTKCDQDVPFEAPFLTSARALVTRSTTLARLFVRGPAG